MNAFTLMKNRLQDISNRHPKAPACLTNGCGGTVAEAGGANRLHNDMLPQLYKCMKPCLKTGGSSLTFSSLSALWETLSLHCLAASFLLKRFSRASNSRPRLPCSSKTCRNGLPRTMMDHAYIPREICRHAILYDTVEPPRPIKRDTRNPGFPNGKNAKDTSSLSDESGIIGLRMSTTSH